MSIKADHGLFPGRRHVVGLLLALAIISAPALGSDRLSLGGYAKSYFTVYQPPDLQLLITPEGGSRLKSDPDPMGSVSNRLRLNLRYHAAHWLSFHAAYDIAPRIQDPILFAGEAFLLSSNAAGSYRVDDLRSILFPADKKETASFAVYQNLDRLSATVRIERFDFVIGRQSIAWGAARVLNPTDIVAPFSYTDLDVEDRMGVDAFRVRYAVGFMGEFDGGLVFGPDFEDNLSAYYLRGKFYAAKTDFSLLCSRFRDNLLFGGDIARSIGGAGTWLEAAYVIPDDRGSDTVDQSYFSLSVGADYSFSDAIFGFAEYHFNGVGATDPAQYLSLLGSPAYLGGTTYLLGRHYVIPGVAYQDSPLLTVSAEVLVNLDDFSALLVPAVEYNVAEDVYFSVGAYFAVGPGPSVQRMDYDPFQMKFLINSEFGIYPASVFSSLRVYF